LVWDYSLQSCRSGNRRKTQINLLRRLRSLSRHSTKTRLYAVPWMQTRLILHVESCLLSKEHYWRGVANVSPTTAILTTSTLIREELAELESSLDLETHQLAATTETYKLYNTFRLRTRSWMCDAWYKRRKRTVCQVKNDYAVWKARSGLSLLDQ
jgi:hypothetical protein